MDNSEVLNLSEVVMRYMAFSGKTNPAYKLRCLVQVTEIWKQIRSEILDYNSSMWVAVNKTKLPYQVEMPKCVSMFLNVSIQNKCGEIVPLQEYNNMPTIGYQDVGAYICDCDNELKECIYTYEITTNNIDIKGIVYEQTTTKKIGSNGEISIITNTPFYKGIDEDNRDIIEYEIDEKYICTLDTKECGCIELSQNNMAKISSCCCAETIERCANICRNKFEQPKENTLAVNGFGYFKYEQQNRTLYLYGDIPSQVMINFKTTGENSTEEQVPNYCLMAIYSGLDYLNLKTSNSANRFNLRELREEFAKEKKNLLLAMPRNKFQAETFNKTNLEVFPKW